jgi:hypothetical protein
MIASHSVVNIPHPVDGIQQISMPPQPESQAGTPSPNVERADLSTEEARDTFWQSTMDRFRVLEWEKERAYAEFHLLSAKPQADPSDSTGEPELSGNEASSTASQVASRLVSAEWDPSSLVRNLNEAAAAVILASHRL